MQRLMMAFAAALVAMVLMPAAVHAQATSSSVWLEMEGRHVLWGCGPNHETALRIKASGGSATVDLGLRDAQSAAATLLEINDGSGWKPFADPTAVTITNGRKTVRIRAKPNAMIRAFGAGGNKSAALLGLGNYRLTSLRITKGERWVFEIDPADDQTVIGQTYGGIENLSGGGSRNYGPQAPGIGVWVVVSGFRPQHGCAS